MATTNQKANANSQSSHSASEVGHAKNLANLGKLIDLATQLGGTYNPNNPQITLAGLNNLQTLCTADYNNWIAKYTAWKSATNSREIAFRPIPQLCTAISDNVKTLNVPQQTIDDIVAIVHKIKGYTKKQTKNTTGTTTGSTGTPIITETPTPITDKVVNTPAPLPSPAPQPISISTSQQSYDAILANFDKLIQAIQGISAYAPNETNIKTASLLTLYASLKTLNQAAINATNALALSRTQRNLSFYAANTGLYDIQKKVKLYIRQTQGSTSQIYHQTTALKFVKVVPGKKKLKK